MHKKNLLECQISEDFLSLWDIHYYIYISLECILLTCNTHINTNISMYIYLIINSFSKQAINAQLWSQSSKILLSGGKNPSATISYPKILNPYILKIEI